jgi:hypothetical protein
MSDNKKNPLLDSVFFPKVGFDASEKVRALCVGTKTVKCRWPHRELHEAAVTIDRLIAAVVAYRATTEAAEYAQENKMPLPEIGAVLANLVALADEFSPKS